MARVRGAMAGSVIAGLLALLAACGGGGSGAPKGAEPGPAAARLSEPAGPAAVRRQFTDVTAASGIRYRVGLRQAVQEPTLVTSFATSGVAAGDYDNDGDIDLFITRGDIGPNLLYRNRGNAVFDDVAAAAGLAYTATANANYRHGGPAFADMDGDGDLDLFIGGLYGDPSRLYANNGDGTFTDVTPGSGIDTLAAKYNISAAFGDYDLDGDADLFIAHWGTERPLAGPVDTEHLWRNDSDGDSIRFTSVSIESGIAASILVEPGPFKDHLYTDYTFTPIFVRVNNDAYPDILSIADYQRTRVFINNGDGTFRDATDPDTITDQNGMGAAVGDFDNDGDNDWFVSSIFLTDTENSGNRYYRNDSGVFSDATGYAGVRVGGWGWGACALDFENDGRLDIYHTNGWHDPEHFKQDESVAYTATGGGRFVNRASRLGLNDIRQGRGVVCADLDNDGDIDIFQQHQAWPVSATLWRNDQNLNNYLKVKLIGRAPNTEATGARVFARTGATTQMREVTAGSNFVSQNPTILHFGLGAYTQVDELRIEWPDGSEAVLTSVVAGQSLNIQQAAATP